MKKISGFILFLIAIIITPTFNISGMLYACVMFRNLKEANKYYRQMAYSKDQHSNVVMQFLLNDTMTRDNKSNKAISFGNPDETISSVFGKNQRLGTLTKFGKFWNNFLNKIEENHSLKSIEEDE